MEHLDPQLSDLAIGALPATEHARAEAHLAECPRCAELLEQEISALVASVPPEPPPDALRTRLFQHLSGPARFAHFIPRIAALFGWERERAVELLSRIDRHPEGWNEGPTPGIWMMPLQGGPGAEQAECQAARLEPGSQFPYHEHLTPETVLVLQGGLRHQDGSELHRGDLVVNGVGTAHAITSLEGVTCLCLVRTEGQAPK